MGCPAISLENKKGLHAKRINHQECDLIIFIIIVSGHGYHNEHNPIDESSYNAGNNVRYSEFLLHNSFRCPPIYNIIPQTKSPSKVGLDIV